MRSTRLPLAVCATALVLGITGATAPAATALTGDATAGATAQDQASALAPVQLNPYYGTAAPGEPINVAIAVDTTTPFTTPVTFHVTRTDAAHPNGYALPDIVWNPTGATTWPTVQDTAPQQGPLTYTVTFDGDATHSPASVTFTEQVAKYAPDFSMTSPTNGTRGQAQAFTGELIWGHPHLETGTVDVLRTDLDHPHGIAVGTATITADGPTEDTVTFHDTPVDGGTNTYTFTYTGGTAYLPTTSTDTVQVTRANTSLTVSTNASAYSYGGWVHVFAHLGATYNNRQVTLYAQPYAGTRTTVASGTVDANGNFAGWYKISRNTTFTAAFAGDDRYNLITSAGHVAWAYAQVTDQMVLNMATTTIGGTPYAVYYRDAPAQQPLFRSTVAPARTDQCLSITLQRYWSGAWHTVSTTTCGELSNGFYQQYLPWNSLADYGLYRIIGEYVHNNADTTNLNSWGNWQYFTVHPHP